MSSVEEKIEKIESELLSVKSMIKSKEKFFSAAGGWSHMDVEDLKKGIYEARKFSLRWLI